MMSMDQVFLISGDGALNKWTQGFMNLLLPESSNLQLIHKNQRKTICMDNAVIHGYRRQVFQGPEDAYVFRKRAYQQLGITPRPKHQIETLTFPLRLLFLNREGSRNVERSSELIEAINSDKILRYHGGALLPIYEIYKNASNGMIPSLFQVTYESHMEHKSFKEQVQLWAEADVVIGPHGAGLTAIIFSRSYVPLVELIPHKFFPALYQNIAIHSGHNHFTVMGETIKRSDFRAEEKDWLLCELWHGLDILNEAHCHHQYFKNAPIDVDPDFLVKTLQVAIESIPFEPSPPSSHDYQHPSVPEWLKPYLPK